VGYGTGSIVIVIIVFLKNVWEKEEFENEENNNQLYENNSPKFLTQGHVLKAVDIEIEEPLHS